MINDMLAELKRFREAATQGEWAHCGSSIRAGEEYDRPILRATNILGDPVSLRSSEWDVAMADLRFVAVLVKALPILINEIEVKQHEVEGLQKKLAEVVTS